MPRSPTSSSPTTTSRMSSASASPSTACRSRSSWRPRVRACSRPSEMLDRLDQRLLALGGGVRDLPERQRTHPVDDRVEHPAAHAVGAGTARAARAVRGRVHARRRRVDRRRHPRGRHARRPRRPGRREPGAPAGSRRPRRLLDALDRARVRPRTARSQRADATALRDRHAQYFVRLGEQAEYELEGATQLEWIDRLAEEGDNLRATPGTCSTPTSGRPPRISRGRSTCTGGCDGHLGEVQRVDARGARLGRRTRRSHPGHGALLHPGDRVLAGPRRVARAGARRERGAVPTRGRALGRGARADLARPRPARRPRARRRARRRGARGEPLPVPRGRRHVGRGDGARHAAAALRCSGRTCMRRSACSTRASRSRSASTTTSARRSPCIIADGPSCCSAEFDVARECFEESLADSRAPAPRRGRRLRARGAHRRRGRARATSLERARCSARPRCCASAPASTTRRRSRSTSSSSTASSPSPAAETFEAARARGRRLHVDDAVAYAVHRNGADAAASAS